MDASHKTAPKVPKLCPSRYAVVVRFGCVEFRNSAIASLLGLDRANILVLRIIREISYLGYVNP
jgi:hypothetical protein